MKNKYAGLLGFVLLAGAIPIGMTTVWFALDPAGIAGSLVAGIAAGIASIFVGHDLTEISKG